MVCDDRYPGFSLVYQFIFVTNPVGQRMSTRETLNVLVEEDNGPLLRLRTSDRGAWSEVMFGYSDVLRSWRNSWNVTHQISHTGFLRLVQSIVDALSELFNLYLVSTSTRATALTDHALGCSFIVRCCASAQYKINVCGQCRYCFDFGDSGRKCFNGSRGTFFLRHRHSWEERPGRYRDLKQRRDRGEGLFSP